MIYGAIVVVAIFIGCWLGSKPPRKPRPRPKHVDPARFDGDL